MKWLSSKDLFMILFFIAAGFTGGLLFSFKFLSKPGTVVEVGKLKVKNGGSIDFENLQKSGK